MPELFDQLSRLDAQTASYAAAARAAADGLGQVLIPRSGLSAGERGTVLALRRALHKGEPLMVTGFGRSRHWQRTRALIRNSPRS